MSAGIDAADPVGYRGQAPETRYRVLVVDDEAYNLKLLGDLLLGRGYEVFAAADGEQALGIVGDARPDLVLLDVNMPGMDGFETCRRLKARSSRELPVIFLTARNDTGSLLEGFEAGGSDYITKPFDTAVLLARVANHAALGRLQNEMQQSLAHRTAELRRANGRLTSLSRELAVSGEHERRRLAERLHDGPIQDLALARIQIESARVADDAATVDRRLGSGAELIRSSLDALRTLLFDLSPPAVAMADLHAALQRLAAHVNERWPLVVDLRVQGHPVVLQEGRLLALFRATRELVVNAAKHAGVPRASMLLQFDNAHQDELGSPPAARCVTIVVEDQGRGFDAAGDGAGFGLSSVRERLAVYGGTLDLRSNKDGTRATIRLPVTDAEPAQEPPWR